ncbi:MAG: FtsX-like permease family protein, partial [Candidatus Thermoplasmatota archaeon]|nr:FtsX-like permease family protein [Candidatus Thermoplasmatota archaeon]
LILAAAAVKFVMDSIIIRKSREIGTLKALGARDRTVARIFLYQAIFIGVFAGALGLGIAAVLMNVISAYGITLNYSLGAQMKVKFILTPIIALTALALPVLVSVLASILPCEKVARLSPVEAIRRGDLQGAKESDKSILSILAKIWPKFKKSLSPLSLAIDEMKDHAGIYAVVIVVIGIALSVFTLQASYQHNLSETVTRTMKDTICADGMVLGHGSTPRQMMGGAPRIENARALVGEISQKTGYTAVVRSNRQAVVVLGTDQNPIYEAGSIWGIDTKNDESVFHLENTIIKGGYFDPSKDYSQNIVGEQAQFIPGLRFSGLSSTVINEMLQEPYPIIMGEAGAKSHGLNVGSQFSILLTDSTKGSGLVSAPFKVVGIYETSFAFTDSLLYFTPIEAVNQMMGYNPEDGNAVAVKAPENMDYKQIYSALAGAAPEMESFSWHEAVSYMIGPAFDAMLMIVYTAIGITLILAAVIINYAMDSTVSRKTREIGTLKAFGARDRTIVKMFIYQGAVVGALSGIAAIAFSAALAYIIINVIHLNTKMPMGMIMEVGFSVTGTIIAITLLAPIAASLLAAALPSKRAAALSPVEAIRKGELNL